ncbi:BRD4-interacting chromatin-remodeling complex-associated protein-like [Ruditapes philippinarum]|uniref:BRD4-interacting chromatin-remodeling complex-associated protein-like n=1 Tax=Ruditapes philippinarum TaxID=129788 RepID=UPI00295B9AD7|nr:BRD4-interacting chromatin-remodeling complex-associated protein-like [Ruditapes philippinarum]
MNSMSTLGTQSSNATAVNHLQMSSTSQSLSTNQPMMSTNQTVNTPSFSTTPTQSVDSTQSSIATTASNAPQVAVPTQIKIADKVLTLSLTPAQKDKVQSYLDRMTPEQQLQYLQTQQHVLQRIQKQQALNAQIKAQVEAQKKQAALNGQGQLAAIAASQQKGQSTESTSLESAAFKPELKTIPIPNTSIVTQPTDTPVVRATKRSYMDIPKGTLINQQIRQDQNHASNPDTKRVFRSRGDACRRLLRYHVFQNYGPSQEEFTKFDNYMEDVSEDILKKKDRMFEKFRQLLFQETLRVQPSSELVMLQRMQNQDLRKTLEEEKLQVKNNPELFKPMPMKFLCKEEADKVGDGQDNATRTECDTSSDTSMEENTPHVKVEIKEEVVDPDECSSEARAAKMRKLVIKTDGMNFSSSFKRMSMDSSRSSVEEKGDYFEDSENTDYDTEQNISDIKHSENLSSLEDDENTNEYSRDKFKNMYETERATLIISSAEESQDTDMESEHAVFNVNKSVSKREDVFQNRRNFELASESMYYNSDKSKDTKDFSNISSKHSSVDAGSKTYIPKHSASFSNGSVDIDDDSDTEDKFDMYQPITESLTDSEENSYYSADNGTDQRSVMIDDDDDDDDDLTQGQWNKTDALNVHGDSDQESDQEVKAQMESAINSILSLSQGASNDPDPVYNNYSQSDQFYNHDSQSNSLYSDSNDLHAEIDFQTDQSQSSMEGSIPSASGNTAAGEFSADLDAAVNSILM